MTLVSIDERNFNYLSYSENNSNLQYLQQPKHWFTPNSKVVNQVSFNEPISYIQPLQDNGHSSQLVFSQKNVHLTSIENGELEVVSSQDSSSYTFHPISKAQVNKVKPDLIASVSDSIIIHNLQNGQIKSYKSCPENQNPHLNNKITDLDWNPKVSNVIATCDNVGVASIFDLKVKKPTLVLNKSVKTFVNISSCSHVRFDEGNPLHLLINCNESARSNVVKLFDLRKMDQVLMEHKNHTKLVDIDRLKSSRFEYLDETGVFSTFSFDHLNSDAVKLNKKVLTGRINKYEDEHFSYTNLINNNSCNLVRKSNLVVEECELECESNFVTNVQYQGYSMKNYMFTADAVEMTQADIEKPFASDLSSRLCAHLENKAYSKIEDEVTDDDVMYMLNRLCKDRISAFEYVNNKYTKILNEIIVLIEGDISKTEENTKDEENADNFFASLYTQEVKKQEVHKIELNSEELRCVMLNLVFGGNTEYALQLALRTDNYMIAVLLSVVKTIGEGAHKLQTLNMVLEEYYKRNDDYLFNNLYDLLTKNIVDYTFVFNGNFQYVEYCVHYLLKHNLQNEITLLSQYLSENNYHTEAFKVLILNQDYVGFLELYRSWLKGSNQKEQEQEQEESKTMRNEAHLLNTMKLVTVVMKCHKLHFNMIQTELNELGEILMRGNLIGPTLVLFELMGVGSNNLASVDLIKLHLHGKECADPELLGTGTGSIGGAQHNSINAKKHKDGANVNTVNNKKVLKDNNYNYKSVPNNEQEYDSLFDNTESNNATNPNTNSTANNYIMNNEKNRPKKPIFKNKTDVNSSNTSQVQNQQQQNPTSNNVIDSSTSNSHIQEEHSKFDSTLFGDSKFHTKQPPKFETKINPRVKRVSEKTYVPQDNIPTKEVKEIPTGPNKVQQSLNQFGTAFGPDKSKMDYSSITGSQEELPGEWLGFGRFMLERVQTNEKLNHKLKDSFLLKLQNLFGLLRDGHVEPELQDILRQTETAVEQGREKELIKMLIKFTNEKHRTWMVAYKKVI